MDQFEANEELTYCLIPSLTPTVKNCKVEDNNVTPNVNDISFFCGSDQQRMTTPANRDLMSFTINNESPGGNNIVDVIGVHINDQEFQDFVRENLEMYCMLKRRAETDSKLTNQEHELLKTHDAKIRNFENRVMKENNTINQQTEEYRQELDRFRNVNAEQELTIKDLSNNYENCMLKIRELEQQLKSAHFRESLEENVSDKEALNALRMEIQDMKVKHQGTQQHLDNLELAFCDIHQKYSNAKSVMNDFQETEKFFKDAIQKNEDTITKLNSRYEALRAHAQQQIEIANKEINSKRRTFDAELSKLATQIKRLTIQNKSLNEALVQKKTELEEMNKVYDDMLQVKTNIQQM